MDHEEMWKELDNMSRRLEDDGVSAQASVEERQFHLWKQLLTSEEKLQSATQELQTLRLQQADEMKEVESYVAHIRGLLEERECLTAEYERDNEHLRHEIQQIRHQQESQSKELAEMLAQEELGEMGLNSPSEQVAYLLVERATLLERLEAAERRLELYNLTGSLQDAQPQDLVDPHLMGEHLKQEREDTLKTVDVVSKAQSEHISREQNERQRLERDLEEASRRLSLAHQEIRRLTNELDAAKNNNNIEPSGSDLDGAVQEVENLKKEVDQLKRCDLLSLQRAKEQNDHLEAENRTLKQKIHIVELEKKTLEDQLTVIEAAKADERSISGELQNPPLEKDPVHKRCDEAVEDVLVQVRELQRQLQKLRNQQEELEERNEELEALLGEAQNASKEERHRHEGELEGLHRKIKSLDAELKKQDAQEKTLNNGEEVKSTEAFLQMHLRESSQERLALLEARLTEEKNWRKQLEMDLSAAQAALKKDKEALQIGERELKKLRLEINSLYTECQQGKTLIKSLTQVKGEKAVLEEKVAQMERAHSRLQSELQRHKESKQTQENLKENRPQVDHLQEKADRLTAELSTLQTENNTLREERNSERLQTADLHAKLSASVQEKLAAEGEAERLELEIQNLQKQLKWHQDALDGSKKQEVHLNLTEARLGTVQKTKKESLDELLCLKEELNYLQTKLTEEQKHAAQHQMVLQAQVNEAQARVKSQDSVLRQKGEEAKQMKQDLQRAQNLFTSAEKELRYEKEKNLDLKRHNTLLDQEKLKLSAELKQIQTKLVHVEQKFQTQVTEIERQQQKIRELELELARTSTNHSATTSLQEDLQAERARLITADEKVVELQQQLKSAQHHLRLEEARACESSRLERDSRDLSDTLSALRAQQQEEHITRKLLEQREEELQQQVRSLRLKETSLNRTNTELSHRVQQLDTRLSILEAELSKAREEAKENQKSSLRLQEELITSQQECERLQGDVQQILLQLDANIRKYNEKHSQHKTKLRQAKQVFLKVTAQRDCTIQKLENDLVLASSLSHKEKEQIHTVVEENEKLLEEKRELLRKISEAEEMGSKGMRTASTVQHRVNVLEVENRQLQERTMMLSNQVSSLERALRNIQSLYSLESAKKPLTSEGLTDSLLPPSSLSLTTSSCDVLEILDAICRAKVGERAAADGTRSTFCTHPPSEQGYLNLTSTSTSASPASSKVTGENCGNDEQV